MLFGIVEKLSCKILAVFLPLLLSTLKCSFVDYATRAEVYYLSLMLTQ